MVAGVGGDSCFAFWPRLRTRPFSFRSVGLEVRRCPRRGQSDGQRLLRHGPALGRCVGSVGRQTKKAGWAVRQHCAYARPRLRSARGAWGPDGWAEPRAVATPTLTAPVAARRSGRRKRRVARAQRWLASPPSTLNGWTRADRQTRHRHGARVAATCIRRPVISHAPKDPVEADGVLGRVRSAVVSGRGADGSRGVAPNDAAPPRSRGQTAGI